jgi:hypothetical protein
MSSNNRCNFCNTGTPICHYTFPTGARFNCCSACAPLLADFGEESMRALERHGPPRARRSSLAPTACASARGSAACRPRNWPARWRRPLPSSAS